MSTPSIEELQNVSGIGPAAVEKFREAGYESLADLKDAGLDDVTDVPGVGKATAQAVLDFVADRLADQEADPDEHDTDGAHTDGAHTDGAHTDGVVADEEVHTDGEQVDEEDDAAEPEPVAEVDTDAHTDDAHTDGAGTDGQATFEEGLAQIEERLTAEHLKILTLFHDPRAWARAHEQEFPNRPFLELTQVLEHALPELRGQQQTYDTLWGDLYEAGLVTTESLHVMTGRGGALSGRTSALGDRFLAATDRHE